MVATETKRGINQSPKSPGKVTNPTEPSIYAKDANGNSLGTVVWELGKRAPLEVTDKLRPSKATFSLFTGGPYLKSAAPITRGVTDVMYCDELNDYVDQKDLKDREHGLLDNSRHTRK